MSSMRRFWWISKRFHRGGSVGTPRGVFERFLKEVPAAFKDVSLVLEKVSGVRHEQVPQENHDSFFKRFL